MEMILNLREMCPKRQDPVIHCAFGDVEKSGRVLSVLRRNAESTFYLKVTGHAQKPFRSLVSLRLLIWRFALKGTLLLDSI